jgi:AbrB family looped-hinge helix DNA binding protein
MAVEMTKMSPKGQVVIPRRIREEMSITAGNRFVVYVDGGSIVFRKIEISLAAGLDGAVEEA